VRYESLVTDLNSQLSRVAAHFGRAVGPGTYGKDAVGWNASKASDAGRLGRWRGRLSEDDIALYDKLVPCGFAGRWDHR